MLCTTITVVSELSPCMIPTQGWNIPHELRFKLADPKFFEAGSVDLLIGAGTFYELLEAERLSLEIGNLHLQGTKFGWIVTGEVGPTSLISAIPLGESIEDEWKVILPDKNTFGQESRENLKCIEVEKYFSILKIQFSEIKKDDLFYVCQLKQR